MAFPVTSTKEAIALVLTNLETAIGQTSPLSEKSFLRVLATNIGLLFTSLFKYSVERSKQNLAETATGEDLELIGTNYGITKKAGVAAVVTIDTTGTNGVNVTPLLTYVSDFSGIRYMSTETVTIAAGVATFTAQAEITGEDSNLTAGDTLTIESQVAGLSAAAAYNATTTTGTDREEEETYRRRVLTEIRTVGGGGNSADYRTWGEETSGVAAVFPYAGRPAAEGTTLPGDRTIYVQASTGDGTADSALITATRLSINIDPDTGLSRPPLGMPDSTLFIESITLTQLNVEVENLDAPAGEEASVQTRIEAAVEAYLEDVYPWISGLDLDTDVNNVVTGVSVGNAIQAVLDVTGSSATRVRVKTVSPDAYVDSYELGEGELVVLNAISYTTV
jgi:hypothetical protein